MPGEGAARERIGALLMGYYDDGELRYAGRVGTGSPSRRSTISRARLAPLRRDRALSSSARSCRARRVFVEPCLVAEVEFREWTRGWGHARTRRTRACARTRLRATSCSTSAEPAEATPRASARRPARAGASPEALFDEVEPLPDGALAVLIEGRRLKLSNWDKVLFPETGFTKGDLIAYYARIAPGRAAASARSPADTQALPERRRGPVLLREAVAVAPARVGRDGTRIGDDRLHALRRTAPTLVWLANLADIELHTSLVARRRAGAADDARVRPRSRVRPPGLLECCEVALVLRGLFEQLGLESVVKTSGSKGLQVYVPLNTERRPTSRPSRSPDASPSCSSTRLPELVVSRMTKSAARRARCSSTGARTTRTRRRSTSTRCARASARRSRRRSAGRRCEACRETATPGCWLRDRGGARARRSSRATCSPRPLERQAELPALR